MTRTAIITIGVALALSACAEGSFPVLQSRLNDLRGQPVKTLVDKLGDPDEQSGKDDEKAYVRYGLDKSHPLSRAECTIEVFVDKDDKITGFIHSGNNAGCGRYAHQLDDSYRAPNSIFGF